MKFTRRSFLAAGASAVPLLTGSAFGQNKSAEVPDEALEKTAARPVLDLKGLRNPVIIESIQLLRKGRDYFVRVRSQDGAEGVSVDNGRADVLHPILHQLVIPYFIGKDARDLEEHLFGVYRYKDNYKLQGLALWCPVALVEFAVLDLLGRLTGKSLGALLGNIVRTRVPFYIASGRRDTTPEQEVDYLKHLIEESGAKAVKYRVGGRMNRNSYDPPQAIQVGRMLEDINAVFFEEPCPFDNLEATKKVADALTIPVALGEQEYSAWRFQWTIRNRVADIIQPDLFYYGGLIRSIRVARMADLREMPTTAHISGGFGFVYMLHFASCVPKIGPWQEYKEGVKTYGDWFNPPLRIIDGAITVPTGPGAGVADPKELLKGAETISA